MTITRQEYEIMHVKDGELHDRSLIESTLKQMQDAQNNTANVRRENKTYSYKEQLAEIELRKELEAKKAGKLNGQAQQGPTLEQIRAQMSKKQQEQLDLQIQREQKTRDELRKLDQMVRKVTQILTKCIHGNSYESKMYLAPIIRTLIKLARSPLCIQYTIDILNTFIDLDYCGNSNNETSSNFHNSFYKSIVYCIFRLADQNASAQFLESRWTQEPLNDAYVRILNRLRTELLSDSYFDLSKSTFFYPFLKVINK